MRETVKQFDNVSVVAKANVYFDGKVVSHTVLFKDGTKKTVGLIYPGTYTFNTGVPEKMEVIAGTCRSRNKGVSDWSVFNAGTFFKVPGNSAFDISVEAGVLEYICSFE
jgi:uncharacterized protein YaiE (UPF0345 family)